MDSEMQDHQDNPPRIASWMVSRYSMAYQRGNALGDLEELYIQHIEESGKKQADLWYWNQALKSIPHLVHSFCYWRWTMLKNHMKIAWRNISRSKLFTIINLLGLAVGMTCFILITLWVRDELSYDRFLTGKNRLFLLTIEHPDGILDPNVPYALAPILASRYPEIAQHTRIFELHMVMTCAFRHQTNDGRQILFYEDNVNLVDPSFFSMFSFPFVRGNPESALRNPAGIVITDEIARKYFGDDDPMGKTLTLNHQHDLTVTGVVDIPENSHLQLNFIAPLSDPMTNNWNWGDPSYVLLDENADPAVLGAKIQGSMNEHFPNPLPGIFKVRLLPVTQVYLEFGRRVYVYMFSAIAALIILIACLNYMNLSTACAEKRVKEMGLRKIIGAQRRQLAWQVMCESLMMSAFSMAFSLVFVSLFLPILNELTSKRLSLNEVWDPSTWVYFLVLFAVVGILSGTYPALVITASKPLETLNASSRWRGSRSLFRMISVVGQFTISVMLVACTLVVYRQIGFIQNRPLGYNPERVIQIPMSGSLRMRFWAYKSELLKHPNILHVTASHSAPYADDFKTRVEWEGKDPEMVPLVRYTITNFDYIEAMGIELVDGRSFSPDNPADRYQYLINQAAAEYMEFDDPIGKRLTMWGRQGTIIGVAKDFHQVSLHREILPQIITIHPALQNALKFILIKIKPENIQETLNYIEVTTRRLAPNDPYDYRFVDQGMGNLYEKEQKLGQIVGYFSIMAIFISCLGIFGLSAYTAEQRTKEIGIRKTVGASMGSIVLLLSKSYSKQVLLANFIAWPAAWWVMNRWLQNFAYRTSIGIFSFILSGLLAFGIALLTVSYQSIRAARANPVEALRYE